MGERVRKGRRYCKIALLANEIMIEGWDGRGNEKELVERDLRA